MPDREDIGFLIKLIYDAINRQINRELSAYNLTNSQSAVLAFLYSRGSRDTTFSDVQEFLNVSHPTVAGLIRRLEKKGFVRVTVSDEDHRARLLHLESEIRDRLASTVEPTRKMEELLTQGFTETERKQLSSLLSRVYENIQIEGAV